jgi:hypothetical protein
MTTLRKPARIISASLLLTLALTLSAVAQSPNGATRLLTIYCPSEATASIGGHGTATRGPVRQYVLNFPVHMNAGFDVYVDITGLVGKEQRSVSRTV